MSLKLTLDLEDLTVEKLNTFVRALESAGARPSTAINFKDNTLIARLDGEPGQRTGNSGQPDSYQGHSGVSFDPVQLGDAALNSLIDALVSKRNR